MDYFADRNFGNNSYDFHNEKKISISEDRRINSTVRWGIRFMLVNKNVAECDSDIACNICDISFFLLFFNVFYKKKEKNSNCNWIHHFCSLAVAALNASTLPVYINIIITIVITFISVLCIYEGRGWNKCIFVLAFNAIWMMIETVSGYILSIYCNQFMYSQMYGILGSIISKILFLLIIFALRKVFLTGGITEFSVKHSIMLILIPIGSIYVMNQIFLFSYKINNERAYFHSAIAAIILLCLNVLIFYIYVKLMDDLQLRRMTSVYEQQLELCERHQQERELLCCN